MIVSGSAAGACVRCSLPGTHRTDTHGCRRSGRARLAVDRPMGGGFVPPPRPAVRGSGAGALRSSRLEPAPVGTLGQRPPLPGNGDCVLAVRAEVPSSRAPWADHRVGDPPPCDLLAWHHRPASWRRASSRPPKTAAWNESPGKRSCSASTRRAVAAEKPGKPLAESHRTVPGRGVEAIVGLLSGPKPVGNGFAWCLSPLPGYIHNCTTEFVTVKTLDGETW